MRKSFWLGLVLLVIGLIVALSGPSFVEDTDTYGIGDAQVTIQDREGVPSWLGWAAAGIGLVLMVTGIRGRDDAGRTFDDRRPHTP